MLGWLSTESRTVARLYAVLCSICFSVALFAVKVCETDALSAVWIRGIGCLILSIWQVRSAGESLYPGPEKMALALLRVLFLSFGIGIAFIATRLISMTVWAILARFQMLALLIATIVFFGIKFDVRVVYTGILSFFGATLVIAPSLYGFESPPGQTFELTWTTSEIIGLGLLVIWLVVDTVAYTLMTKISSTITNGQGNVMLNCGLCLMSGVMILFRDGKFNFYWHEIHIYAFFIVVYFLGSSLLFESSKAEKDMGILSVLNCSFLITSLILEMIFYKTQFTLPNFCGCVMVIFSSVWAVMLRSQPTKT